jgi:hypothetical protein
VFGRTHERLARTQETYIVSATTTWLESLERSLVQLKEYQAARKRLDSRRLAYDTSLAKMQKAKKEDFRVEEELRTQKAKYEESEDDVQRRMQEIRDADPESVSDLAAFLDAELAYHDKCREALLQLKSEWPARYVLYPMIRLHSPFLPLFTGLSQVAEDAPTLGLDRTLFVLTLRPLSRLRRPLQSRFVQLSNRHEVYRTEQVHPSIAHLYLL